MNQTFRDLLMPGLLAAALLLPLPGMAANCEKNPNHHSCNGGGGDDGGDPGNEKLPLTIVFGDAVGDNITSDLAGSYDDGVNGVEAFIGSSAKTGDILLKTGPSRTIGLNISNANQVAGDPDPNCWPDPMVTVTLLEVDVQDGAGTPNGVYDLESDPDHPNHSVDVTMRVHFSEPGSSDMWFLNFGRGDRNACGREPSSDVRVTETSPDVWDVTNDPQSAPIGCLEKKGPGGKNKIEWCGSYNMPFSFTATPLP